MSMHLHINSFTFVWVPFTRTEYAVQTYRRPFFQRKSPFDSFVTVNNQVASVLNEQLQRIRILEMMLPSGLLQ